MTPFDLETLDPAFFDVQTTNCHQKVENWSRVTTELAESFNFQVNFLEIFNNSRTRNENFPTPKITFFNRSRRPWPPRLHPSTCLSLVPRREASKTLNPLT